MTRGSQVGPSTLSRAREALRQSLEGVIAGTFALGLVSGVVTARYLGPQGRGTIAGLAALTQLLGWIGSLGTERTLPALAVGPNANVGRQYRLAVRGVAAGSGVASLAGVAIGLWWFRGDWFFALLLAAGVAATAWYEMLGGALLAAGNRKAYVALRIGQPLIFAVATSGAIVLDAVGANEALKVQWVGISLLLSLSLPTLAYRGRMGRSEAQTTASARPLRAEVKSFVSRSARNQASTLLQFLNNRADVLLVGLVFSTTDLGFYTVGTAGGQLVAGLGLAQGIRGLLGEGVRHPRLRMAAVAGIVGVMVVLAPQLVTAVYGEQFAPSVPVFRVAALGGLCLAYLHGAAGRLLGRRLPMRAAVCYGCGVLLTVVLVSSADSLLGASSGRFAALAAAALLAFTLSRTASEGGETREGSVPLPDIRQE